MNDKKQIEEIFEDLIDAPAGGVKEDFTIATIKDKYTDAFIRTIASHLASKNYRKQSEGEWIETHREWDFDPYFYVDYTCSVCGNREQDKRNFCPNCGARMKGGETDA